MKSHLVYCLMGCLAAKVTAQCQFYNLTGVDTGLSSTCLAVLNQAVACDSLVAWAGQGRYEDDTTLKTLCTTTCTKQLSVWLSRVTGACTARYVDGSGNAVLPAYWVESIVENYNLLCLQSRLADLESSFANIYDCQIATADSVTRSFKMALVSTQITSLRRSHQVRSSQTSNEA